MYPMENDIKKCIEEHTEKLAAMVAEGFASTATKQEVSDLRTEVNSLRTEIHERFDKVEARVGIRDTKRLTSSVTACVSPNPR